jgi:hypothetical protein
MLKLNIAFDVDDTFVDNFFQFASILKRWTGKDITNATQFNIEDEFGIDSRTLWDAIEMTYKDWKRTPIYPGAKDLMAKLNHMSDAPIYFVTARPARFANETYKLIKRFCPHPFKVAMCHDSHVKHRYLTDYKYYVDDRRATALSLARKGWFVYMPARSYNEIDYTPFVNRLEGGLEELIPLADKFVETVK